jgi:hypothetical protein
MLHLFASLILQDLPSKPKYLVTFTVGYAQKANIDAAVKKVKEMKLILNRKNTQLIITPSLTNITLIWRQVS